jgi:hypothetical protein
MTSPTSPALALREELTALATKTHDTLTDAGCNCEYIVAAVWQRSNYPEPEVQVRHAPECAMNFLPPGGEPDADTEDKQPAPTTKTRRNKKPAAKPAQEQLPVEDEGGERDGDRGTAESE